MLELRRARFADAVTLAPRLRFADAREIATQWGLGAGAGLMACLVHSDRAFAVTDDGGVVALWGVSNFELVGLRAGSPWLLASEQLFSRRRLLIEQSRHWVGLLLDDYDLLCNVTDAANSVHVRWLKWCGFELLRLLPRHGAAGRACWEFCLINHDRVAAPDRVREALRRREPAPVANPLEHATGPLVTLALRVLRDGWRAEEAANLLDAVAGLDRALRGARRREAALDNGLRLAEEVAAAVLRACAEPGRRAVDGLPWFDLCRHLYDLDRARRLRVAATPVPCPAAGPGDVAGSALATVLRAHAAALMTESGGQCGPAACRRERLLAVGGFDPAAGSGLSSIARAELDAVFRARAPSRLLVAGGGQTSSALATAWRSLLALPLDHDRAMAAMAGAAAPGTRLRECVLRQLDGWAASDRESMRCLSDGVRAAGLVADEMGRSLLPEVRLGAVAAGYVDRVWLYRLLRVRLLAAVCADFPEALDALLQQEVTALLMAAAVESTVCAEPESVPWPARLGRATLAASRPLGSNFVVDDDLAVVAAWLRPWLALPALHGLHLQPALTTWHLHAAGGLEAALITVSDLLDPDPLRSRLPLRRFLRRLASQPDRVEVTRLLGIESEARHARQRIRPDHARYRALRLS